MTSSMRSPTTRPAWCKTQPSAWCCRCADAVLTGDDSWVALRFLVHFVGDVHQPLHLTNRERGGNGDPVLFEGRHMNLHALWDNQLIAKAIRTQRNYTTPLPARQIEDNLRGAIYDPYIRLILWEGVRKWWRSSLPAWLTCSPALDQRSSQQILLAGDMATGDRTQEVVCPEEWAQATHKITCDTVFPKDYDYQGPLVDLNTKEYYGPIRGAGRVQLLSTLRLLIDGEPRQSIT